MCYDVAIIGGGPAGSIAGAVLARKGRKVVLLERDRFPRFHIGESLLPHSMNTFEKLGLTKKFDEAGFMRKFGGEIASGCGAREVKFFFRDGFRSKREYAYQVPRAEFDHLLLRHAEELGVEVRENTKVISVDFRKEGVSLRLFSGETISARYLLDCSGRHCVVGNYFRLKKTYPHLNKMALYAHYRNVFREEGEKGTLTRMVRLPDRWFWMIPLDADRTSVGVVMDTETFRESKMKPEEALEQSWRSNPVMYERMKDSERVTQVYSSGDYSYRVANMTGDQWMLAGDAAGFIDPIFSSGVFLAIYSGENAAEALHRILDHPTDRQKLFRHYERDLNRVMDLYLRFVNAWYRKEFVEVFLNPTETLQLAPAVNALLAGNTGRNWQLAWRLKLFEFFVWAQRFVPLSPRLALTR